MTTPILKEVGGDSDSDSDIDADNQRPLLTVHEFDARDRVHERARSRMLCMGGVLALMGVVVAVVGAAEFGAAESERLSGWDETVCSINTNHGSNDTVCIYLTVEYDGHRLCAVPATLAAETWFHEPPACMGELARWEHSELEYWRSVTHATVKCLVPRVAAIDSSRCIGAATSHSIGATLWRTYVDRFVYLVHTTRDGSDALTNVTSARRGIGLALLVGGLLLVALAATTVYMTQCVEFCHVVGSAVTNPFRVYRHKRAVERHYE